MFGGKDNTNFVRSETLELDFTEQRATLKQYMNKNRACHCAYLLNGIAHIFGGFEDLSAERYFITSDSWQNLVPMPFSSNGSSHFTCAFYKGGIVIAAKDTSEIVRYDPATTFYTK
jgi:hypothetical protein